MDVRVPSHKNNIADFIKQTGEIIVKMISSDKEKLKSVLKNVDEKEDTTLCKTEEEIDNLLDFIRSDRYELKVSNEYINSLLFEPALEVAKHIFDMSWEFLIVPTNLYFVTSDNPVISHDKEHKPGIYGVGYKSSPTVELFFPISPKICFHGQWLKKRRNEYRIRQISSQEVKDINLRICNFSNDFVFSCNDKLQIDFRKIGQIV